MFLPSLTHCGILNLNLNYTQVRQLESLENHASFLISDISNERFNVPGTVKLLQKRSCILSEKMFIKTTLQ